MLYQCIRYSACFFGFQLDILLPQPTRWKGDHQQLRAYVQRTQWRTYNGRLGSRSGCFSEQKFPVQAIAYGADATAAHEDCNFGAF
jgi:hypothetical protein